MFSSSMTWDRSTTPDQDSNSRPPDLDSTLHVTETPSLTTRPSVTSLGKAIKSQNCDADGFCAAHGNDHPGSN